MPYYYRLTRTIPQITTYSVLTVREMPLYGKAAGTGLRTAPPADTIEDALWWQNLLVKLPALAIIFGCKQKERPNQQYDCNTVVGTRRRSTSCYCTIQTNLFIMKCAPLIIND